MVKETKPCQALADEIAALRLKKARTAMVMAHPFFASLALRLDLKEDRDCATAWTDGNVMAYNPDYIKILSHEKLVGLTAHTVMHPACGHHQRRGDRDPNLWNRACDYVINPILLDAGLTLPDGFLSDPAYAGKSVEAVYALLKQGEDAQEKGEDEKENPDPDKENQGEESAGEGAGASDNQEEEKDPNSDHSDPGMAGEVRDFSADPKAAPGKDQDETDWEQALVQAAASARAMGHLPRGIDLFVEKTISPKLPWQDLLAQFIQQSARTDYAWTRPNRRYIHQDLYLPSLVSDQLPELVVAVDTSGSIQNQEMEAFGAELSAILAMNPSRIHLVYCDMAVQDYQVVEPWDLPLAFAPKGGGGTDFRPVFDMVREKRLQAQCLIYLSDMACTLFPEKQPDCPVLWVNLGSKEVPQVPFGRTIQLKI